ncbi:hypothetical protein [Citricoccus sp.]|nr:hypothetical protein [Citricoccus sp.]
MSAIVFRTMYGSGFATPPITHGQFVESLVDAVWGYLDPAGIDPPDE